MKTKRSFTIDPMEYGKKERKKNHSDERKALDFELPVSVARTLNQNTHSTIKVDQMDDLEIRGIIF